MTDVRRQVDEALGGLIKFLEGTPFSGDIPRIETLRCSVDEPCSLAIAGQVKTGKSSFLNALLGENLALVGTTETTATVTTFRYGRPPDEERPVRCEWVDGRTTWESRRFLDSLQGSSVEALRRANAIRCIEYHIENPILANNVKIVDTPGSHAVIEDDVHERRTAEYFALSSALRERHDRETISLSSSADAIVYLTSCVIGKDDSSFLSEFQGQVRKTSSESASAANIICLISRADLSEKLMGSEADRAEYIAIEERRHSAQLRTPVTVLAVSSQLKAVLGLMTSEEWATLFESIKRGFPASEDLDVALMGSDRDFCGDDFECGLSPYERKELLNRFGGMSWSVIKIVLRTVYGASSVSDALKEIERKSGFPATLSLLENFFFARGSMLRCNTVIQTVLTYLDRLCNSNRMGVGALRRRKEDLENRFMPLVTRLKTSAGGFLSDVQLEERVGSEAVRTVIEDLQGYLMDELDRIPDASRYAQNIADLYEKFAALDRSLDLERLRYEGLLVFENNPDACVNECERMELKQLLNSPEQIQRSVALERQLYWRSQICRGARERLVDIVLKIYERSVKEKEN